MKTKKKTIQSTSVIFNSIDDHPSKKCITVNAIFMFERTENEMKLDTLKASMSTIESIPETIQDFFKLNPSAQEEDVVKFLINNYEK